MNKSISRRDFIQTSAFVMTGLGLNSCVSESNWEKSYPKGRLQSSTSKTPTYCEICFWKCAGWVHTQNGKPWKIIGNEIDQHSLGRFCTRGTGGIGSYTDEDRLRKPLLRKKINGVQKFIEVNWEEALDFTASKLKAVVDKYGAHSVALFNHGTGGTFFKTILEGLGSDSITAPSYAQCRGPREEAFYLTFGEGVGSPERMDIKNSRCLVLIGSHLGENLHNTQVQEFGQAIDNGCSIITVDPRFSVAASKSKHWLPIKPGTDLALLLAWTNVLLEEGIYNRDFVEKNCIGLEQLKESVKNNTPEWAYPITSLKPELIRETAKEMAKQAPATLIHPSRHVTWYGDDTQRVRAIAILNALLGSWGAKGGYYLPNTAKVAKYPIPKFPKVKKTWQDRLEGKYSFAGLSLASGICDATAPNLQNTDPYKAWVVYGTNLIETLPQREKTIEALKALHFMVAIDTMPAEITGWADVVLPECTYLERFDDLRVSPGREAQVALRAPAFEPKYDSKPGWWIARELGHRLGLEKYFPWNNIEEYLDVRLNSIDSSLDEMKKVGVKKIEKHHLLFYPPGQEIAFDTPSGKIELFSQQLAESGFDPIPKFTKHPEPPKNFYRLLYGRSPAHTFGRTINNPLLNQLKSENEVWVHPHVARKWGIENGDRIRLINQDGIESSEIKTLVTERIRTDCVYMVHGFGQNDKRLSRANGRGASDGKLISKVNVDPIMGGTGMRVNFVSFLL